MVQLSPRNSPTITCCLLCPHPPKKQTSTARLALANSSALRHSRDADSEYTCSSVVEQAVSKTEGRGFEPLQVYQINGPAGCYAGLRPGKQLAKSACRAIVHASMNKHT